jgi:hypothetical protein
VLREWQVKTLTNLHDFATDGAASDDGEFPPSICGRQSGLTNESAKRRLKSLFRIVTATSVAEANRIIESIDDDLGR